MTVILSVESGINTSISSSHNPVCLDKLFDKACEGPTVPTLRTYGSGQDYKGKPIDI